MRMQLTTTESLDSRQHSHGNQVLGAYLFAESEFRLPPSFGTEVRLVVFQMFIHALYRYIPRGMWYDWKGGRYIF